MSCCTRPKKKKEKEKVSSMDKITQIRMIIFLEAHARV